MTGLFIDISTEMSYICKFLVKNMRELRSDKFIYEKHVKFQVEFPDNQIRFPGSHTPLDRIFYTNAIVFYLNAKCQPHILVIKCLISERIFKTLR